MSAATVCELFGRLRRLQFQGVTPLGWLLAAWYVVLKVLHRPSDTHRCIMGYPVHPAVLCPRPSEPDSLWCKRHHRWIVRKGWTP